MANKNKLKNSIDNNKYLTFLIGCKYLKGEVNTEYYEYCQQMANDFMKSKFFDISEEDFNIKKYLEEI